MNKEEKQAVEYLKKYIKWETQGERSLETDIQTVLNLIQKQEAIIDKMAEYIDDCQMECNVYYKDKEEVIEYFEKEI